ncbi:MAG: hypothetical protein PHW62_03450 [Candidatus Ratteibacteria bacterium]|nr:hypothetical protein [Candidatus Ratteibacteria bacterium]
MKKIKILLVIIPMIALSINLSGAETFEETKNEKGMGLLIGDPVAVSVKAPVNDRNFWDFRVGIWTWYFWHDQEYNTPYLSIDYNWFFPLENSPHYFYTGLGLAFFLSDNPKDVNDYDACAAVRFPIGRQLYKSEDFSIIFEVAPIYQFAPPYDAKPYIFELNAGIMFRHYFN